MDRGKDRPTGDRRRREDTRDRRPRYDRERSRSPAPRDRRPDSRRERSPPRGAARGSTNRSTTDRDSHRGGRDSGRDRQRSPIPPPSRGAGDRAPLNPRDGNKAGPRSSQAPKTSNDIRMTDDVEDEDEEAAMKRLMGFANFRSTKNTKVPGNDKNWGLAKEKPTQYRQYMNREGGFNRALSPGK